MDSDRVSTGCTRLGSASKAEEFQHKGTKINTKTHKENTRQENREEKAEEAGHEGNKEECAGR
jgi:hypothetical protein